MISETLKRKFDSIIARYPLKRSAIGPLLLMAQDELGYISDEAIEEIAYRVEVRPIEVVEDISYYSMLRRQPIGRYNLQVCTNISCMLRGGDDILAHVEKRLGCKAGQSSADGKFYLKQEEECLAACCGAPMMMVDHVYHENLTPKKVDDILDAVKD